MMFDPNAQDNARREMQQLDREERAKKDKHPFEHREMASKCPKCALNIAVRGKRVCRGTGSVITETSGTGECAFEAVK